MSRLTDRAVRIYAILEDFRRGSADILDSILPFFQPILMERNGRPYDPAEIASATNDAYRWNLSLDVAEELISRFEGRGWVQRITASGQEAAFLITCENHGAAANRKDEAELTESLKEIGGEFEKTLRAIAPLSYHGRSPEDLIDILIEWLISIDAYNEDILRDRTKRFENVGGRLVAQFDISEANSLSNEDKYVCARFVNKLFKENSRYTGVLCRIASIGLLTEVVQDFRNPTEPVENIDLCFYLDGPVAMDFLGVSGAKAADNTRALVRGLTALGGSARIFDVTLQEIQRALGALLDRPRHKRTGPTADALRRGEVLEGFVREVANSPSTYLKQGGIGIVSRRLNQFPGQHAHFDADAVGELESSINWHFEEAPRKHDAEVIAHVMRMRAGVAERDIFTSRHILITRSAMLSKLARRFAIDKGMIAKDEVSPAIHQRLLATSLWLRAGANGENDDIPRRQVLSACERVLELNKNVTERVLEMGAAINEKTSKQLELLLSQNKSVQLLQDRTLNSANVLSSDNFPEIFEAMRREVADDIAKEGEQRLVEERKKHRKSLSAKEEAIATAAARADAVESSLNERDIEDADIVDAVLGDVNERARLERRGLYVVTYIALGIAIAQTWLSGFLSGFWDFIVTAIAVCMGAWLGWLAIHGKGNVITALAKRRAEARLSDIIWKQNVEAKFQRFPFCWNSDNLEFERQQLPDGGSDKLI